MLAQFECKRAGLGDIVLPGLLLCFSLRLDDAKASEGRAAVAVAGFLIARCAGPDKYFTVVDQVFRSQSRWTQGNIKPIFQEIAVANGLDQARFEACLQDQDAADAVGRRAQRAADEDGVNSTPTLFINGKKVDAPQSVEELDALMAKVAQGGGKRGGR